MQCYPSHILAKEEQFFRMKRNKRFPRSDYADNSRLEYLASGMAGAMVSLSPMTAIERLRNMRHGAGGPFWKEREEWTNGKFVEAHCTCWWCTLEQRTKLEEIAGRSYANGLKLFLRIADRQRKK